ncbi:zinc CCCH type domain-containing protein [Cryptosporidium andersoni]|uniref:Zinc CCCH type domain-containing protein n=1 Tax=Cryptosporidium andersoni TaxID=117008 RepID=A0A1J4MW77_9CRYT|nr:zinc CCCH type domain-containing protein [Cryptosporidium andersoni]
MMVNDRNNCRSVMRDGSKKIYFPEVVAPNKHTSNNPLLSVCKNNPNDLKLSEITDKDYSNHYLMSIYELYVFRIVVCDAHLQGNCEDSDRCPFSHCLTWQRRNPDDHYYCPKLCPEISFVKNNEKMNLIRRCKKGKHCTFAHSKEEQLYHPLMYKTKECSLYPNCNRYYCPFSHGFNEIRSPEKVRESIQEIMRSKSNGVFRNPRKILSSMDFKRKYRITCVESGESNRNLCIQDSYETFQGLETTYEKTISDLSSNGNKSISFSEHDLNHDTETNKEATQENIVKQWSPPYNWLVNTTTRNVHPNFAGIIRNIDDLCNLELESKKKLCNTHDMNKNESEYDLMWQEISNRVNNGDRR